MKLSEIKTIIRPKILGAASSDSNINELAIDSRKIQNAENCLFIALSGTFRNGHQFLEETYEKGIRYFLVSKTPEKMPADAVFLIVSDTLTALQQIAATHRRKFHFPILTVTGSNGKTIIKEWLFQLLAEDYQIVRNPKSYNSQIGVPLSVWQIKEGDQLGIFEAGISLPGEMNKLEQIIQPDWGLFTNIGDAHSEGFQSQKQKIREKLQLFKHVHKLFYCLDHKDIKQEIISFFKGLQKSDGKMPELYSWSTKEHHATLKIDRIEKIYKHTTIKGLFQKNEVAIQIPFSDDASIENAIHCWLVLLTLGIEEKKIQERMRGLHPVTMRLESVQSVNNSILINDTYNSDLSSFRIALNALMQQTQYGKKTIILSDMFQIGQPVENIYQTLADWVKEKNISRFIGIGQTISGFKEIFYQNDKTQFLFFPSTEAFIENFPNLSFQQEAILLKGARKFRFERIAHLLEQKVHQTVLEINLSALINNLKAYKRQLPPAVKIMAMVKAYSYGSGSYEIAHALQEAGVNYLAVAYVDEGVMLRKAGIHIPIMVMSPEIGAYDRMIFWKLEPEIFSLESLLLFQKTIQKAGQSDYPIHIKLDTGMHRLGFLPEDIQTLKEHLENNTAIHVVSIFSHLAGSGEPKIDDYTAMQISNFKKMSEALTKDFSYKPMLHILNSTGITRHTKYHFDMVRLGLGLYGIDSSRKIQAQLIPIGTLKTRIAQIHHLKSGAFIGYDLKGKTARESRIATVNIGYADGYFRDFGNGKSYMLVQGKKAPVIGAICMDMCMLDVTDIPEAKAGDEAVVFGKNPDLHQLSEWAKTIPYEIMTAISQRVNRVYIEE